MKIDHLTNVNRDYPKDSIIRIFDFDPSEACLFKDILSKLAHGLVLDSDLSNLPFVSPIDGCRLILKLGKIDVGAVQSAATFFECILTQTSWSNAEELVGPFCEGNLAGYQWLYDLDTDIELLFSPNGEW